MLPVSLLHAQYRNYISRAIVSPHTVIKMLSPAQPSSLSCSALKNVIAMLISFR